MLMLAQRWPYVVYPTPTISQRYNGLPMLAQPSHAIWAPTYKSEAHYFIVIESNFVR